MLSLVLFKFTNYHLHCIIRTSASAGQGNISKENIRVGVANSRNKTRF